ncbi:hypothetical protein C2S51_036565 [Perilla frutescens var. frutescens]|nr:hypothetical protein C2S51_036565 [Perilla frutescens var. frutescens]
MATMLRSVALASASFPLSDNSNKVSTFSVCNLTVIRSERSSILIQGPSRNEKVIPKVVAAGNYVSLASNSG